ncbi:MULTISPECIES: transglycosylase domain-containing protein [Lentibacter]|jgi:penicillin-binding protein 1A|uniref:peptidoglycan glycosyltransferase n=2 Tax=Lentibacter algarum TaxID=576131 RepID=A0A1H3LY37_9RHOB|nr:PBP1A family penicillin-binding protein [Lentibacter algarum]WIF32780.1 penicillin-binding protein, 1A family [Lentibacter algarum]SDY68949.1 penicillin-binding protein, 1A family [Lentibacter algarum]
MSNTGRKKPPLVAERRYPKKTVAAPKKRAASKRSPTKPKRGLIRRLISAIFSWIFRIIWGFGWRLTLVCTLLLGLAVGYVSLTLPPVEQLFDGRARGSVTLLDASGSVFAWRGDQFGGAVTATSVSPHLKNAIIATEDKRFYQHFGLSPRGIASAVRINLREGRGPLSGHGGSTLTQQTAKLICLGVDFDPTIWKDEAAYEADCRQGSLARKAKEAIYSMAMEVKYTKNEILTVYINRAFLGAGARGFEAASQRYFGKSAAMVAPNEAAMLAGLLVAPTRYAPTNNLERSQERAATVVRLMEEQGYLSATEAKQASLSPATLSQAAQAKAGGYFADWVMTTGPDFFTRNTTEDVIIRTTLDQRIQRAAEAAIKDVFDAKVSKTSGAQAAILIMSADGAVRAMVGGRQTQVSGAFNRATMAKRQPGSAFKPFVYAAALDIGRSPFDLINDEAYCIDVPGSGKYCPNNYNDKFHGTVTLTEALKKSYNIPAVKLAQEVGLDTVRKVASDFGIESDLAQGPALALGASEASLLEMTGAYAGILNGGSAVTPYGLIELKLLGNEDPLMTATGGIGERVIQQESAEKLIWMMNKVVTEGTGGRARLADRDVAGKTGTSQSAKDAWFIGFTADYVAGVWIGYDDNTPLQDVTGSGLPAEIWQEAMKRVHEGLPIHVLPMRAPETNEGQLLGKISPQGGARQTQSAVEQLLEGIFGSTSGTRASGGTPQDAKERQDRQLNNRESR